MRRGSTRVLVKQGRWYGQVRLSPEKEAAWGEVWRVAVDGGAAFEAELKFRTGTDRVEKWSLIRAVPFLRANQDRAGWVGTCTDLTDRRARETALRMAEKLELTGRMTGVIAHEINNPLEAITNLLYLLGIEVRADAKSLDYIEMAEYELERISGITKQTLRWSKESVQNAELGRVGALFEDVVRLFAGKMRNRQVTVTILGGEEVRFYGVSGRCDR